MIRMVKDHWPVFAAIVVLWVTVFVLLFISLQRTQGQFVYALDDCYIHMAIAKNVVQYGVWGVTHYGFSSTTTSLLWIWLLSSVYFIFGVNEITPLILNLISGTGLLGLVYVILKTYECRPWFTFIVLLTLIFFTSLPPLILTGMEHTLQALISILFVYLSATILTDEYRFTNNTISSTEIYLLLFSPFITMIRYEGIFLLFIVCILFIARRRLLKAVLLGGCGILPIVIYGFFSVLKGWFFLPNSVVLKGKIPQFSQWQSGHTFFASGFRQIVLNPPILILMLSAIVILYLLYRKHKKIWQNSSIMLIIFILSMFFHIQFAQLGWFFRYEAYLVALGIVAIAVSVNTVIPQRFSLIINHNSLIKLLANGLFILLVMTTIWRWRGVDAFTRTPREIARVYNYNYQTGLFLREYYQNETIAMEDIGAINYFADIKCIDLGGLANMDAARAIRAYHLKSQLVNELAKRAKICVMNPEKDGGVGWREYGGWNDGIPKQWIKVGVWKVLYPRTINVTFYAIDPLETRHLQESLRIFSSHLTKDVLPILDLSTTLADDTRLFY